MAHNADQVDPMAGEGLGAPADPCVTLAKPVIGPAFPLHVPVAWGTQPEFCVRFYLTLGKL